MEEQVAQQSDEKQGGEKEVSKNPEKRKPTVNQRLENQEQNSKSHVNACQAPSWYSDAPILCCLSSQQPLTKAAPSPTLAYQLGTLSPTAGFYFLLAHITVCNYLVPLFLFYFYFCF